MLDPRWFQILSLLTLLIMQQVSSDFSQNILFCTAIITTSILAELLMNIGFQKKKSLHSSVITGLSLSLLLRSNGVALIIIAPFLAIMSKRLIVFRGAHIYNPANFAIAFVLLFLPNYYWIATGVWAKYWLALLVFLVVGSFVTKKAKRLDIPLLFLVFYLGMHTLRLIWLGDPLELLAFRANSLALIIFSFFMISDPKTTPRNPLARLIFSLLVATIAFIFDAVLFERNGLFWALAIASPTVILFNKFLKGERYQWPSEAV